MPRRLPLFVLLVWLSACSSGPQREPAIGEAFVGPATYQVRTELTARAEVAAIVKHGERLEVIGRRRRFLKVRTAAGAEGWMDSRLLLTPEEMKELKTLAGQSAAMQSFGSASVFETLNVHTAPNRQAPSFVQIPANGRADVIWHQRVPRTTFVPPEPTEAPAPPSKKKAKKAAAVPPPPRPKAPAVPGNWLELSGNPQLKPRGPEPAQKTEGAAAALEDWTLVRTADGRAGWVLSHMLFMAIPDEVAQHAERARIVTYFTVAETRERDGSVKPAWLWTTLASSHSGCDYDAARLFVWNARRKRYETTYIERGLCGFLPVSIQPAGSKNASGFSMLVQEKDGSLKRRQYVFQGQRARLSRREAAQMPAPVYVARERKPLATGPETPQPEPGAMERLRESWRELRERLRR